MKLQVLKLTLFATLFISIALPNLSAQEIFTLDLKTNTIKRSRIELGDSTRSSMSRIFNQDTINHDYLMKRRNRRFDVRRIRYKNVFRRPLKVGDYLTFQVLNVKGNFAIDSIATTYNFFDRNVQEYSSIFKNIVNSRLEEFNSDDSANIGTSNTSNTNESPLTDRTIEPLVGNFNAAMSNMIATYEQTNEIDLSFLLEQIEEEDVERKFYHLLFNRTSNESGLFLKNVFQKINDSLNIVSDFNSFYAASEDLIRSDSMDREIIIDGLINKYENQDLPDTILQITNRLFGTSFNKKEMELLVKKDLEARNLEALNQNSQGDTIKQNGIAVAAKIDSSHVLYAPLQILNQDITYFYVQGYKEGKKVYERPYVFLNRGGFKVDFSAGFIGTTLKDDQFFLKPTKDTSYFEMDGIVTDSITSIEDKNIIRSLDNGKFQIGISIMGHFYSRIGKRVNLAISPGFYLNTDSNINYLIGGSALLGLEQRFILNVGCAFGKVKTLNPVYDVNQHISTSITTLPEIERWKSGFFVGISYNL